MKKIFTLAIALIAFASVASAQNGKMAMQVNFTDGSLIDYYVDDVESVTFVEDPWTLVGIGNYAFAGIGINGSSTGCEIYQNANDPKQWKIEDWLRTLPLTFTYDESANLVTVDDQDSGYYTSSYGENIWVDDPNHWLQSHTVTGWSSGDAPTGYYENDVFYFSMVYYLPVYGGYYGFTGRNDKGYETFTITSRASAPAKKGAAVVNVEEVADVIK